MSLTLPRYENIKLAIDGGTDDDYALVNLYYTWFSGWFYRHRLSMVAKLFGDQRLSNVLEVGVGSGIFIQEALKHSEHVTGIDIHASYGGIKTMLEREGVDLSRVDLQTGSILEIPFENHSFDAAISISVLEHFADPYPAVQEMRRVTKPGGFLILGFPAHTPLTDKLFRLLGYEIEDIHPATHNMILSAIRATARIEAMRVFPASFIPMYFGCRAVCEI